MFVFLISFISTCILYDGPLQFCPPSSLSLAQLSLPLPLSSPLSLSLSLSPSLSSLPPSLSLSLSLPISLSLTLFLSLSLLSLTLSLSLSPSLPLSLSASALKNQQSVFYFVACPTNCDHCGHAEVGQCDSDGCASGYDYNTRTKLCHPCPTNCDHCGYAEVGQCDSNGCASDYVYNTTTKLCQRRPYCDRHNPCEHGGTCISKGPDNYVCMCPKCGCSSEPALPNCRIDKTTICGKDKFDRNENLLDHPYNCAMYIACNMDHTYNTEGFVWSYEDGRHVFYRAGNRSAWDYEDVVKSCKQEPRTQCAKVECLNGATCEDTLSGFRCNCAPGYKGTNCEIRLIPCVELPACDHGRCVPDTDTGSHCECDLGYRGRQCDIRIKYCADITCYNGGTCKNRVKNDSICECTKDFTGIDCGTSEFYWH
ncbi:hypothetical protein NP493_33g07035 [Ridgeia piscesae]|uniref:EGF-like domain-containing protein n=1 Tax=Ridgeia piscesae TaxID=27915 RepID=A0AAD9PCP9_RIDPI|nr:hypothetical protein NP493_33g07035 [Ridgeia piscesae]